MKSGESGLQRRRYSFRSVFVNSESGLPQRISNSDVIAVRFSLVRGACILPTKVSALIPFNPAALNHPSALIK